MKRATILLAAVGCWLALALPAAAADLNIKAFFGKFTGSGIAQSEDSIYFATTVRDTDVEIGPTPDGFRMVWTTVLRQGGDPSKPNVRRRQTTMDFTQQVQLNQFKAKPGEGIPPGGQAWARINGNTLTVYIFGVDENGMYEIQSYARTLTGAGMDLIFSRIKDGEETRTVKAKLTRMAN
jgi:hypothetical protein